MATTLIIMMAIVIETISYGCINAWIAKKVGLPTIYNFI